jgi:Mrp family chromosome partitioning ATPase
MSLLDRAFVKAYTRSHSPSPSPSHTDQGPTVERQSSPQAVSLETYGQEAMAWGELPDESYFRVDVGHLIAPKSVAAKVAAPVKVASQQAQTVSGLRPAPPTSFEATAISHTLTAYDASPRVAEATRAVEAPRPMESTRAAVATEPRTAAQVPPQALFSQSDTAPRQSIEQTYAQADLPLPHWMSGSANTERQVRIDEAHHERVWRGPSAEPMHQYRRPEVNTEEAAAFARAKGESIASAAPHQEVAVADNHSLSRSKAFEPVWEVDAFEFSDTIVELFGDAKLMKSIGIPLDQAVSNGLKSILITSASVGVGKTSVAIGVAVSAAAAGLRVALVDGDIAKAGIADALRLEVVEGWPTAIKFGQHADEVAIRSIEDQLTVVPARTQDRDVSVSTSEFDTLMSHLRDAFDLIVVDGAAMASQPAIDVGSSIDAAIMVVDSRNRNSDEEVAVQNHLRRAGVTGLGIVENFT